MNNKKFGYIRISSKDQNIDRQMAEMKEIELNERDIFTDKQSGKDFKRPQYQALKQCLRAGDVLFVKSIDRFGRNSKEIMKEWDEITQDIKADIVVLDMPLLDTRQYKDLMGDFVSRLVLQVLSFVAQKEREDIHTRQAEGIAIAKAQGKHLGRKKIEVPDKFSEIYIKWKDGEIKAVEAIKKLGLKKTTFYQMAKSYEDGK